MKAIELVHLVKRSLLRILRAVCAILLVVAAVVAYARFVEPHWLRVHRVVIAKAPTVRIIHISDVHFAGDTRYLHNVVDTINRTEADLVCFTGDLVEDAAFLDGALHILVTVNKPMYGVPGNHDKWALRSFDGIRAAFSKTGGAWLSDSPSLLPSKRVALMTLAGSRATTPPGYKRVLLEHYPDAVEPMRGAQFDLILAGHTHGQQVRLPFVGKRLLPFDVGTYDRGLFQTPCGPLYVNPGIGTYYLNVRFLCRPEVTVIDF